MALAERAFKWRARRHIDIVGAEVSKNKRAAIAQLGERQTEDLKVPGSIPGLGSVRYSSTVVCVCTRNHRSLQAKKVFDTEGI